MAKQIHVFGPTLMKFGATVIGQSNGNALITIREVQPYKAITTDAAGGAESDFIQMQRHAIVVVSFIDWDDAEVHKLIGALDAASVAGTPAYATEGKSGTVGMLQIADGGYQSLTVVGTKLTVRNGGRSITFPRAFRDPASDSELSNIGVDAALRGLVLRCHPNASDEIYTLSNIT